MFAGGASAPPRPRSRGGTRGPPAPTIATMTGISRTGGQAVVQTLAAAGIRFAFTVPGESFLCVPAALPDSTPRSAGVGQVPRAFRGREAFQEVDQVATFGRLCKAAVEVDDAERLAAETARMVSLARSGRPGPGPVPGPADVPGAAEAPVVAAWRRPDVSPNGHRLYLGMSALSGPRTVRERLVAADVVVAV